ncbi:hypothetical protein H4Q26_017502 [Puccinia striiformis f. sp. tritici PST-130]|nr:hypothetical protein H4Q26_017502 [Puccinia striiformis f. sp. tritici PST-130]
MKTRMIQEIFRAGDHPAPRGVGDTIDEDSNTTEDISKKIEGSLRAIEQPDAVIPEVGVNKYLKRVFILPGFRTCRACRRLSVNNRCALKRRRSDEDKSCRANRAKTTGVDVPDELVTSSAKTRY